MEKRITKASRILISLQQRSDKLKEPLTLPLRVLADLQTLCYKIIENQKRLIDALERKLT